MGRWGLVGLSPVPRFWVFLILSAVTTVFTYNWWGLGISAAIVVGLFLIGGAYPMVGIISALVAGFLTFLGNLFLRHQGEVLLQLGLLQITSGSLERALLLGLRLMVMILLAIAYIAVTPNEDLLLTARGLKLPKTGEIYLMIVLRYIDILKQEFTTAMQSMAIRGVRWDGSILDRIQGLSQLPMPIIYRLVGHIYAQTLALDSRGGVQVRTQLSPPPNPAIALKLMDTAVTYHPGEDVNQDHLVLHPINLSVLRGERLHLWGRTGSGRSTLLLLAAGLIPHSTGRMSGQTHIFGYDTRTTTMGAIAQQVRMVFPSAVHGLIGVTVRDELALSLRTRCLNPELQTEPVMVQALRQVGLGEPFLNRKTLELSGGEMQRVALASALVCQPPMLLLDDVTGQLDPVGREEVREAIEQISSDITLLVADTNINPSTRGRDLSLGQGQVRELPPNWSQQITEFFKQGVRVPQLVQLGTALCQPQMAQGLETAAALLRPYRLVAAPPAPNHSPANPILEAEELSFAYRPHQWALKGINTTFYRGQFTAILGANGSGKTTLSLLLAKALRPTQGGIRTAPATRVGYVFQEPTLQMLATSVAEEIAFAPRQLGWSPKAVAAAVERELARFRLPPDENPVNLPPAQARLLAIAAILAMDAQVVILDEPTNGLDEIEIQSLMHDLTELQQQGLTLILVTHDVEIACTYAQRLLVMAAGQIQLDGVPHQVMAEAQILQEAKVKPPAIAQLCSRLWPDQLPAVTVEELLNRLQPPEEA